uniref:Symbiosis-related protein n=1 Tax=Laccaria bicolor TaxID=29883 RepID=P87067_LACBI|nr:symbiosis-related transcription factor [Laccaria bicolor]AAF01763.1 symbiosis-related protein [Laccaria bicolor]
MVQLTTTTAAVAAAAILAVPAIAGPIHGSYLQSRSTESNDALEARMIKAMIDLATHGPARSMITKPGKDQLKEAAKGHSVHQPYQKTLSQKVYEQTHNNNNNNGGSSSGTKQGKRDLELELQERYFDDDVLESRMFKAVVDLATHGPARSMITKPGKDQLKEAAKGDSVRQTHQKTLSQKVYEETHNKGGSSGGGGSKQGKRDLEELQARMFKAVIDAAAHGPARSVITKPIKEQAKDAAKGNSVQQPHQKTLSQKVYEQTNKGGSSSKQGKRDLEELQRRMFKAVIDAAAHGPARSVITKPIKEQAKDAAKGNSVQQPHQKTLSQKVYEQTNNKGGSSKQGKRDLEELEARMFKAVIDAAAHGPARSVITKPIKEQAKDAAKGNSVQQPHQKTLSQKVYEQTNNKGGSSKQGKRDLDELEARWIYEDLDELD